MAGVLLDFWSRTALGALIPEVRLQMSVLALARYITLSCWKKPRKWLWKPHGVPSPGGFCLGSSPYCRAPLSSSPTNVNIRSVRHWPSSNTSQAGSKYQKFSSTLCWARVGQECFSWSHGCASYVAHWWSLTSGRVLQGALSNQKLHAWTFHPPLACIRALVFFGPKFFGKTTPLLWISTFSLKFEKK